MGVVATVASLSIAKKPIVRLPLMVCCSAMVAVGMLLACTSSAGMVVLPLTASAVAGLVLGLSMSTSQTVLYRRAASEHIGTSSGLLRTSIYIGSIGASSLSGVFFGETSLMEAPRHWHHSCGLGSPRYWRRLWIVRCGSPGKLSAS